MSTGQRDLSALSDAELLIMMRDGEQDEAAFVTLYRRQHDKVYRFSMQMSGSKFIAEDVTQEVFLTLVREPTRYDPERGCLGAFLCGMARNYVLRRLGADRRFLAIDNQDGDGEMAQHMEQADPHSDAARAETVESVRRAILSLPEHYREAVVLCDLHEMTYEDASVILGCAVGTVRSRLHRARKILLDKLRPVMEAERQRGETKNAGCLV